MKKRRLDLRLIQREAAKHIGVSMFTLINWETEACAPEIRHMPSIIRFLGYDPFGKPTSFPEQLRSARRLLGIRQSDLAVLLDVDPSTISGWETHGRMPIGRLKERIKQFLEELGVVSLT